MQFDRALVLSELDRQGFSVVSGVLARDKAASLNERLLDIAQGLKQSGTEWFKPEIDPNASSVRVYNLPDHDPIFVALLTNPEICDFVAEALGGQIALSNFTANIALPGARPMKIHSDQALSLPEPWLDSWVINVIWCLDDLYDANGATRYLPGSHKFETMADLPPDIDNATLPFEAPAGSIIFMDGRLWHSSGSNVTQNSSRPLLFAYYARAFIRSQINWHEVLRPEVVAALDARQRELFGFGQFGNTHGLPLVLQDTPAETG